MVEFFELVSAYWNKSKKDWQHNRHRLYTLFAFVIIAYLVLEFGSYVFTRSLNEAKTTEAIRAKFMDRRVAVADEVVRKLYRLKENTRLLLIGIKKEKYSPLRCETLKTKLQILQLESDLFVSASNIRYFFGNDIIDEMLSLYRWYDANDNNCFQDVKNAENEMDTRVISIRDKMQRMMYPPKVIEGLREEA